MSNPTSLIESFNGSLGAFAGVDPIRYDTGLWVEEGTTNLANNPVAATNTSSWSTSTNRTLARVTSLPAALPSELAALVTTGFSVTATADIVGTGPMLGTSFHTLTAGSHSLSIYVYIPTAYAGSTIEARFSGFTSATGTTKVSANMSLRDQWQRVSVPDVGIDSGDTGGSLEVSTVSGGSLVNGDVVYFAAVQCEKKSYVTSFALTTFGSGYSATNVRAASSASISPSGILAPDSGALAFRITPTIETGLEEIWGECGVKGAGTDHLRWGRDASTHPFVEWSANDAAYQRLTGTETLSAGTAYDLYLGHTGTVTSLAVDAGTLQTGTRAAVSGDFSTGDLTLEASAGGVIYQPFATFNRTLTAKEIATLNGKNNWTMKVLAGNPYRNFQLRPY